MTPENYQAINKALCYAEAQVEVLIMAGDHETAREIVLYLAKARVALNDEANK